MESHLADKIPMWQTDATLRLRRPQTLDVRNVLFRKSFCSQTTENINHHHPPPSPPLYHGRICSVSYTQNASDSLIAIPHNLVIARTKKTTRRGHLLLRPPWERGVCMDVSQLAGYYCVLSSWLLCNIEFQCGRRQ